MKQHKGKGKMKGGIGRKLITLALDRPMKVISDVPISRN